MSNTKDMEQAKADAKEQGAEAGVDLHDDSIIVKEGDDAEMTAMQVLLSAKPVRQQRKLIIRERDGLPQDLVITVGSLTDLQFKAIGEEAESPVSRTDKRGARRGAAQETETDNNLFLRLIVANAIADPNLHSPEVLAAHGAVTSEQVVSRVFLPGEIARIAEEIMDLSGWSDDAVEVAGK